MYDNSDITPEAMMGAMGFRSQISDGVDEMLDNISSRGVKTVIEKDGEYYINAEVAYSVASLFSEAGLIAMQQGGFGEANAYAYACTVVNVLAYRVQGKEPNDFGEVDKFLED